MDRSAERGFKLTELAALIAAAAMLSALAVPHFAPDAEDRAAAVEELGGTLRATAAMAHAICVARDCPRSATTIPVAGRNVVFVNTYPDAPSIRLMMSDLDGFATDATGRRFMHTDARVPQRCWVQYNEASVGPDGEVVPPTIEYAPAVQSAALENTSHSDC